MKYPNKEQWRIIKHFIIGVFELSLAADQKEGDIYIYIYIYIYIEREREREREREGLEGEEEL